MRAKQTQSQALRFWHWSGALLLVPAAVAFAQGPTITTEAEANPGGQAATTASANDGAPAVAPAIGSYRPTSIKQSPELLQYNRTKKLVRENGFGDLEVDILHGRIASNLQGVLSIPGLDAKPPEQDPKNYSDFWELVATSNNRLIAKGTDIHGDPFVRVTIREGSSYSTDTFPINYVYRAHAYLFPNPETGELDRIIFQFYRINYTGQKYTRELRRLIHPNPRDVAQAADKQEIAPVELLDNSELTLEFYEAASTVKPIWEGSDGIPLPDLSPDFDPLERVFLNKKSTPLDYEEQTRMMVRYKRLLRTVDRLLYTRLRSHELNREVIIERLLDFPS